MPTTIEEIKAREQAIKDKLADPTIDSVEVPTTFFAAQIGLTEVLAGPDGRLWICRGSTLTCVYNRNWRHPHDV